MGVLVTPIFYYTIFCHWQSFFPNNTPLCALIFVLTEGKDRYPAVYILQLPSSFTSVPQAGEIILLKADSCLFSVRAFQSDLSFVYGSDCFGGLLAALTIFLFKQLLKSLQGLP